VATPFGDYHFRGGHRLWHAPEGMPRSYIPDDKGARVEEIEDWVVIRQPVEEHTGIAKTLTIRLDAERPRVVVEHELRNEGASPVRLAPWAISMLRLGGVAVLPQPTGKADAAGLLPNRQLVLWPYTQVGDARLVLRDDFVLVKGAASLPPLKLGYANTAGWLGYWLEGTLLVKRFKSVRAGAEYADMGCNAEMYCNDRFIELESLGPLVTLEPGATAAHTETWEVYTEPPEELIPAEVMGVIGEMTR
jgi:hypothetical protein